MAVRATRADPGMSRRIRHLFGCGFAIVVVALLCWIAMDRAPQARSPRDSASDPDAGTRGNAAATPSSEEASQDSLPAPEPARLKIKVCDLFDSRPLPNIALEVKTTDGGSQVVRTDGDGITEVTEKLIKDATEWRCESTIYEVASSAEQVRRESTVWCVSHCEVRGRVVFGSAPLEGGPVGFEEVSVSVSPAFVKEAAVTASGLGGSVWFRRSALREQVKEKTHPDETGTFLLRMPRLTGAAAVARARGYRPAWETLDEAALRGEREGHLVLEPGYRIEGTAHDKHGVPLAGARVHVYVVIRSSISEFDNSSVGRIREGGFTLSRSVKNDLVVQKLHYRAFVDPDGRWSVDLGADGEGRVVCYPDSHAPIERDLGRVSGWQNEVVLVGEPSSPSRVLIQRDGQALSNRDVMLTDLSHIDAQHGFRVKTDAAGVLTTPFLVRGKPYSIWPLRGGGPAFVTYTGQRVIDLADCETSFDKFFGRK